MRSVDKVNAKAPMARVTAIVMVRAKPAMLPLTMSFAPTSAIVRVPAPV